MHGIFRLLLFIIISTKVTLSSDSHTYNVSKEKELYKNLLKDYNKYILPKYNKKSPILVGITVFFLYLDNVDIKSQTYTVRSFFLVEWTDNFLTWDSKSYPGVDTMRMPIDSIWTPILHIEGIVGMVTDYGQNGVVADVYSDGYVNLWPSKVYTISCVLNVRKYPFDVQNCELDFSSWIYQDKFVNFTSRFKEIGMRAYKPNGEWRLEVNDVYYYTVRHDNSSYSHVVFPFVLHRKWQFVVLNTFFPTVCTSLLTLLCFVLPNESGEKVGLSISIFLTLAVFMTVTSDDLPRTADSVSLLGAYVALQLAWSAMTIVLTVGLMAVVGSKWEIPNWINKLLKTKHNNITNVKLQNIIKECTQQPGNITARCAEIGTDTELTSENLNDAEENLSSKYVAAKFNSLCFYCCLLWHFTLHIWFLIQVYS